MIIPVCNSCQEPCLCNSLTNVLNSKANQIFKVRILCTLCVFSIWRWTPVWAYWALFRQALKAKTSRLMKLAFPFSLIAVRLMRWGLWTASPWDWRALWHIKWSFNYGKTVQLQPQSHASTRYLVTLFEGGTCSGNLKTRCVCYEISTWYIITHDCKNYSSSL